MSTIKSLDELKKIRAQMKSATELREKGQDIEKLVQVKVSMGTCGIVAGARETLDGLMEEVKSRGIDNVVFTQTGCMGYCHSEPTVEITLPGQDPVVFGDVSGNRISEIVERYIVEGELVDGVIPVAYKTIHE
ncbi:(2Fe-2S) ferredoxin domain-containing protein [Dethiosulfovibrio sp. F2B]|uniref:(2Fe-2S) ferredoxin domain-containing protein n=1 Tax=Dethiosulfovibrio faecalis TaxID=2720018 RepID=UPI001F406DD7|nr:(2Fe-2S) ferredoxin domain-containing protein [Dethiosulfovibrio faecalis]MCF4152314.1 (2Fe-2S) ferredoxin domain-containing protein [Dethiosulfovibrio faecalis]